MLLGAGGAGAATMLLLLLADGAGASEEARLGPLLFALLVTLVLPLGLRGALKPGSGAPAQARSAAALGTLLWLTGLGGDLFRFAQEPSLLVAFHGTGLLGALGLVLAGARLRPLGGEA